MVEILVNGQKPEDRQYTALCRKCNSLLRFKRSEATFIPDQRDGDMVRINCPVCKNPVHVSETAHVRRMSGGY